MILSAFSPPSISLNQQHLMTQFELSGWIRESGPFAGELLCISPTMHLVLPGPEVSTNDSGRALSWITRQDAL